MQINNAAASNPQYLVELCTVDGCDRKVLARNLCSRHYRKARAAGQLTQRRTTRIYSKSIGPKAPRGGLSLAAASRSDRQDCIEWQFGFSKGAPRIRISGEGRDARIVALEWRAARPDAPHHRASTCGNRSCVNGSHMRWKINGESARKPCEYPTCHRPHDAGGYCKRHDAWVRNHGSVGARELKLLDAALTRTKFGHEVAEERRRRFLTQGPPVPTEQERCIIKALRSETDECLAWPYRVDPAGYGQVKWGMVNTSPHAVVAALTIGPRPEGHMVCHTALACHNPSCINPRHIRYGTQRDNAQDRLIDGTQTYGKVMSDTDVLNFLAAVVGGATVASIAHRYPVSYSQLTKIARGASRKALSG